MSRIITCALALFLLWPAVPARSGQTVDRIVAVVNGEIITLFEINERIKPLLDRLRGKELTEAEKKAILDLKRNLLTNMIDDILLAQQAEKYNITASDVEIDNRIQELRRRDKLSEDQFLDQLKLEGMTLQDLQDRIRRDILKQRLLSVMVKSKAVVTRKEVKDYYKDHKEQYRRDKKVSLSLLVLAAGKSAKDVRSRIQNGTLAFDEALEVYGMSLAEAQSIGLTQGDIGELEWETMSEPWKEALDGVDKGGVSKTLNLQGREALLRVDDMSSGDPQTLEEVEQQIRDSIRKDKLEARFDEYMGTLRNEALIEDRL